MVMDICIKFSFEIQFRLQYGVILNHETEMFEAFGGWLNEASSTRVL